MRRLPGKIADVIDLTVLQMKRSLAMRKISLVLLGATAGAALALLATQPRLVVIGRKGLDRTAITAAIAARSPAFGD